MKPNASQIVGGNRQTFSAAKARRFLSRYPKFWDTYPVDAPERRVPSIHRPLGKRALL